MYSDVSLLIDGGWRPAVSGKTLAVLNPATGDPIGNVAHAEKADLDLALAAAQKGFAAWRKVSAVRALQGSCARPPTILRARADEIATQMTMEQGKPRGEAKMETLAGADIIDWFAEEGRRTYGRTIPARVDGVYQLEIKEPVGPVAAFTPWNFPINQAVRKISAALATGCSIIIKGPEETPASCAALVDAFVKAGLPAGVINLVFGVPAEISSYLIPHPVIRKISFTGSTAVGKHLAVLAGPAHEARHHGARRPCAGDRVRRRRYRCGGEDAERRQVPQCRPGLRRADPLPGAEAGLRRVRGQVSSTPRRPSKSATASRTTPAWARSPTRAASTPWRRSSATRSPRAPRSRPAASASATRAISSSRPC